MSYTKKVQGHKLPNGFKIFFQEDESVNLTGVYVRAGAIYDPSDIPGFWHINEHNLFERALIRIRNGKNKTTELSKYEVEKILWEYNCGPREAIDVATHRHKTTYGTDMLRRRDMAMKTWDIFAGMVRSPKITEKSIRVESAAVLTEHLHHDIDNPESEVDYLVHESMYKSNPARNRICWGEKSVHNISLQRAKALNDKFHVASNMGAVILGPKKDKAISMAEKYFSDMAKKEPPKLYVDGAEIYPQLKTIRSMEVEKSGISTYHVALAFPTEPYGKIKINEKNKKEKCGDEALEVLSRILQFRVEYALRQQNEIYGWGSYHPYVWTSRSPYHGLVYVWFNTPSESFVREGEERIIREIKRIKNRGVYEEEIKNAKSSDRMKKEFNLELDTMKRARRNMYYDAYRQNFGVLASNITDAATCAEDPDDMDTILDDINGYKDRVEEVGINKVRGAANKYLTTDAYVRVVLKPTERTPYEVDPRQLHLF